MIPSENLSGAALGYLEDLAATERSRSPELSDLVDELLRLERCRREGVDVEPVDVDLLAGLVELWTDGERDRAHAVALMAGDTIAAVLTHPEHTEETLRSRVEALEWISAVIWSVWPSTAEAC